MTDDAERDLAARFGPLVRMEAHRAAAAAVPPPDPERLAAGWQRRFITDGTRVAEAVALYRELGYEVETEPVAPTDLAAECTDCRLIAALRFQAIYTRRPAAG